MIRKTAPSSLRKQRCQATPVAGSTTAKMNRNLEEHSESSSSRLTPNWAHFQESSASLLSIRMSFCTGSAWMISAAVDCVSQRFNSICRGDAMALALKALVVRFGCGGGGWLGRYY